MPKDATLDRHVQMWLSCPLPGGLMWLKIMGGGVEGQVPAGESRASMHIYYYTMLATMLFKVVTE